MARITIDCADPSDFTAITAAAEKAAGRCNITYAKQAAALVDAGTVKSERAAAKQIAEETGDNPETVRKMIHRGKVEMGTTVPKPTTTENETKNNVVGRKNVVAATDRPRHQAAQMAIRETGLHPHDFHKAQEEAGFPLYRVDAEPKPRPPKGSFAMDFADAAISQLGRIEDDDPKREEALRKVIAWVQQQLDTDGAIDQEASLPPAKSERREKALDVLKPLAEKAITAAIENGLDKALHLNDSFVAAYSTGAGAARVLVAEVVVKKMNGT